MNKEEILTSLRELKDQFGSSLVDEQVKQLDDLYSVKQTIEVELSTLLEKVKNDKNYTKTSETVVEVEQLNDQIGRLDTQMAENNASIANANYRLRVIDTEIEAANELIAAGNAEIAEIEQTITTTTDAEVVARLNSQIDRNRLAIADLERDIETLTAQRPLAETAIATANRNNNEITTARNQYIVALNEQQDRAETTYVDENARQKDRVRILELQRTLNNHNTKAQLLSFDFANELNGIITDLETDESLTESQAVDRVQDFYDHIPTEVFVNDFRNREQALEENNATIAHYEADIATLENKLADENNYQLSLFAVEADEVELERVVREMADNDREIADLNNKLANTEVSIEKLQTLRERKEREYRALGIVVDPKMDTRYGKQLAELAENKAKLIAKQEDLKARIKEAEKRGKELEKQKAELEKNTTTKNPINKARMDEDRAQLAVLMAGLALATRNKERLEYDPQLALLELINGKEKDDEAQAPVVEPIEEEKDAEISAPVAEPVAEDDDIIIAPIPLPVEPEQEDDEVPFVVPEEEPAKEDDDILFGPTAVTDIHDAEPELKEEARKKKGGLLLWIKKYKSRLIAAGLAVVTALLLTSCMAKNNNNDDLEVDPGIIDGIEQGTDIILNQDDDKLTIDELIQNTVQVNKPVVEQPTVTPTPEPEQPTQTTEPDDLVIPTPTPTPVNPTPVNPTPVTPTPVDPTPVDPTPVDPTPSSNLVDIKVNEGETLVFNDGKNDVKVDLSDGENDPYITSTETVGPEQSDAVHGLEYDFTDDGMSATVTVDKTQIESTPMTEEQYQEWLETERENNGITNDLNELLGRSR